MVTEEINQQSIPNKNVLDRFLVKYLWESRQQWGFCFWNSKFKYTCYCTDRHKMYTDNTSMLVIRQLSHISIGSTLCNAFQSSYFIHLHWYVKFQSFIPKLYNTYALISAFKIATVSQKQNDLRNKNYLLESVINSVNEIF
jgi:hypothetical protein